MSSSNAAVNILMRMTGASSVTSAMTRLAGTISTVLVVSNRLRAVWRSGEMGLQFANEMQDLSNRTGESVRDILALREAFRSTGLDAAGLTRHLERLRQAIAGPQTAQLRDAWEALGLDRAELRQMGAAEQFRAIAEAMGQIENPTRRSALAMQIFGRAGGEVLQLIQSPEAFEKAARDTDRLASLTERYGAQMAQLNSELGRSTMLWDQLRMIIGSELLPAFTALNRVQESLGQNMAWVVEAYLRGGVGATLPGAGFARDILRRATIRPPAAVDNPAVAAEESVNLVLQRQIDLLVRRSELRRAEDDLRRAEADLSGREDEVERVDAVNVALARRNDLLRQYQSLLSGRLADLRDPRELAPDEVDLQELRQYLQLVEELEEVNRRLAETYDMILPAVRGVARETTMLEFASESLWRNMSLGLTDAIMGWRSFGDAARSIVRAVIADVVHLTIRMMILRTLFGAGGSPGNVTGGLFGAFGGERAAGGPVDPGKYYVVGERGPELFSPAARGNIVPNHALGGGVSIHLNQHFEAGVTPAQLGAVLPVMERKIRHGVLDAMQRRKEGFRG